MKKLKQDGMVLTDSRVFFHWCGWGVLPREMMFELRPESYFKCDILSPRVAKQELKLNMIKVDK